MMRDRCKAILVLKPLGIDFLVSEGNSGTYRFEILILAECYTFPILYVDRLICVFKTGLSLWKHLLADFVCSLPFYRLPVPCQSRQSIDRLFFAVT